MKQEPVLGYRSLTVCIYMLELGPVGFEAVKEVVSFETGTLAESRAVLEEGLGTVSVSLIHLERDRV